MGLTKFKENIMSVDKTDTLEQYIRYIRSIRYIRYIRATLGLTVESWVRLSAGTIAYILSVTDLVWFL